VYKPTTEDANGRGRGRLYARIAPIKLSQSPSLGVELNGWAPALTRDGTERTDPANRGSGSVTATATATRGR
jgi:hypothetical protein